MITGINEGWIGEEDFSGAGNENFFASRQDSLPHPHLQGLSQMVDLGEGAGRSLHGRGNK